jgi:hypothetical protein
MSVAFEDFIKTTVKSATVDVTPLRVLPVCAHEFYEKDQGRFNDLSWKMKSLLVWDVMLFVKF